MPEGEKQESQKTVVAFITGLLIGGLLVWVFSSTPEQTPKVVEKSDTTQEVSEKIEVSTDDTRTRTVVADDASIAVPNQPAGTSVELGAIRLPVLTGWIVVRDYMDGVPGNVLGAARFNADEGLMPASVELMRATEAGSSYQAVFYTNDGETAFDLSEDVIIEGVSATFSAQ